MKLNKHLKQSFFILTEESFVFASLIKWVFLSAFIGTIIGFAVNFFLYSLDTTIAFGTKTPYFYFALPFIFVLNRLITRFISPDSAGHGTEKIIKAVHKRAGDMRFRVVPIKFFMTLITLGAGGSVGKEGPSAQIGAALSSTIAKWCRFSKEDRKKLVICGVSAGFAAVFGTPIAGAIFGVELLFVGKLIYGFLLPSLISGIVSYHVSHYFGAHPEFIQVISVSETSLFLFAKVIFAALLFGLGCIFFIESMRFFHFLAKKLSIFPYLSAFLAALVVICVYLLSDITLWGLGTHEIEAALQGNSFSLAAPFLKTFVTAVTLHFGGSGGILTPILFVGSTFGSVIGNLLSADVTLFAALGLVSFLAGTANTPIASCLLAIELFGTSIAPFACISCILSFLVSGYRSVYPAQIMSIQKTHHSHINLGESISKQQPHLSVKSLRTLSKSKRLFKEFKSKVKLNLF